MSNTLAETIQRRISEVAAGRNNCFPWEQTIAREYQVLPLYGDLGGCLALRTDLEIVAIPDDPSQSLHVETNPQWRNTAFVQGSKIYPELSVLIPQKPPEAIACPDCNGTGIHPITSHQEYENIICQCGGIGWLADDATSNHFSHVPQSK